MLPNSGIYFIDPPGGLGVGLDGLGASGFMVFRA